MESVTNDIRMPTNYVDMSSNELSYSGGSEVGTVFKYAAIAGAILAASSFAVGVGAGFGSACTEGMLSTALDGVFTVSMYGSGIGAATSVGGLVGWGEDAVYSSIAKHK